ncbi:MAG TPA: GTPase Era [Lachnospiraceae bacterium]|nr:GTPase Era [Lachnospiraceae bacterium]
MEKFKSGYAAIIGRPNVGKSTLMNHMIGQKIAITSKRPQTTRDRIETIYTCEKGQIIFLDTPGMIKKTENKLGEYLLNVSLGAIPDADVVLWLVEPSSYIGEGDRSIAERLRGLKKPVLLIINKVDTIEKTQVLKIIDTYSRLMDFAEIIPVSALMDVNLEDVKDSILKYLPEGPKYYDDETVTEQPVRQIVSEIIREKALQALSAEVPHGIAVTIDKFSDRSSDLTDIEATIVCEKDSHKGIIIGKNGTMLKKIGTNARYEIERLIEKKVYLKLWVKVRKNWRDSDSELKSFGYDKRK